jgi:uncharacterized membrane protein YtjA (UPF0391 family)
VLGWALTFLAIALLSALFGFTSIATASAGIAKVLFFVFLALSAATLIAHVLRGRSDRGPYL